MKKVSQGIIAFHLIKGGGWVVGGRKSGCSCLEDWGFCVGCVAVLICSDYAEFEDWVAQNAC